MYALRSDIHCVKYAKTRAFSDPYFPVYDSVHMRENTDQRKPAFRHSARSDKEEITVSNYIDFTILKLSFFQRLIVIELLISEMIEKSYQNYFFLKLSSFLFFLFAGSKSLQKQTRNEVLKNNCLKKNLKN